MAQARKTIAIPVFILSDAQLLAIATSLMAVDNELYRERGPCFDSRAAAEALLDELNGRATVRYSIVDGKIVREG